MTSYSIPGYPANIKKIKEYCSNVQFNDPMIDNINEIRDVINAMPKLFTKLIDQSFFYCAHYLLLVQHSEADRIVLLNVSLIC